MSIVELLPPAPAADGEEPEDPRAELVRRLLEYEQIKLAARALDALPSVAAGLVSLPKDAPWSKDLMAELAAFPGGKNDDQVDPLLDAVALLLLKGSYGWDDASQAGLARIMGGGSNHAAWRQRLTGGW